MASFLFGVIRNDAGSIHVLAGLPDAFVGGLPVSDEGQLCIDDVGAITSYHRGLPITAAGRIASVQAAVDHYVGSWPIAATGRLAYAGLGSASHSNGVPTATSGVLAATVAAP